MKKIVLSTSSSGLDSLPVRHTCQPIRLHVQVNNVDFVDGKNINTQVLSRIMHHTPSTLASTAPASEQELTELLMQLYQEGYREVFICTLSSAFSQSYAIIKKAADKFRERMTIFVYDSKSINLMEAAMAYEADQLLTAGASFAEIAQRLDQLAQTSRFFFTLDDLGYIIRNKRLSAPAGFFASLFDIKPILTLNAQGQIVPQDKVRKRDNALRKMTELALQGIDRRDAHIYLTDGGQDYLTSYYADFLQRQYGLTNLPVLPVSTISLANHGYQGVGIGVFFGQLPQLIKHLTKT